MCASDRLRGAVAALLLCLSSIGDASAQQATREQEQIRRLRQQLQQLQQEQATQQQATQRAVADKAELQVKLDKANASVGQVRATVATQSGRAAKAQQEAAALVEERDRLQVRLGELQTELERSAQKLDETNQGFEQARAEIGKGQRTLAQRDASLADLTEQHALQAGKLRVCTANNQALYGLGQELLSRYANKGVAEAMAAAEPFVQTRRVALENLVQGYQDRLDQDKVKLDAGANLAR